MLPPAAPRSSVSSVSAVAGAGSSVEAVASQVAAAGGEHRRQCFGDRFFSDDEQREQLAEERHMCEMAMGGLVIPGSG